MSLCHSLDLGRFGTVFKRLGGLGRHSFFGRKRGIGFWGDIGLGRHRAGEVYGIGRCLG